MYRKQQKAWDGTFPQEFLDALPLFWARENSVGSLFYCIPGKRELVSAPFLEKHIGDAFNMKGEQLRQATSMVILQCRQDMPQLHTRQPGNWLHGWKVPTWGDLNMKARMEMGL